MPAFPLHGWMPDGYKAMPIEVLMAFSGVLSKVGAYGFLRIVLPLYPHAAAHFQTLMLLIALASIVYGSVVAFTQTDARLIVGEFLILLGVFKAKLAIAIVASAGVVMASVYALRLFIRALHNRVGEHVDSRELTLREGAVLVPFVAVILFMAIYPQLALRRSEASVKASVASVAPRASSA